MTAALENLSVIAALEFVALLLGLALLLAGLVLGASAVAASRSKRGEADGGEPPCPSLKQRWTVVGYGALGGLAGYCLFQGLLGRHGLLTHPDLAEAVVLALCLPLAVLVEVKLVHPRLERRRAAAGHEPHHAELVLWRWTMRGTPALVLTVAFTELFTTFSHRDPGWLTAAALCGTVTWLWMRGVRRDRWRGVFLGGAAGWALGMAGVIAVICLAHSGWFSDSLLPAGHLVPSEKVSALLVRMTSAALAAGAACGLCGALGGLFAGLAWGRRPATARSGLLGGFGGAALSMTFLALFWAAMYATPRQRPASEASVLGWPAGGLTLPGEEKEPEAEGGLLAGAALTTDEVRVHLVGVLLLGILSEGLFWMVLGAAGGLWVSRSNGSRSLLGLLVVLLAATLAWDALVLIAREGWLGGLGLGKELLGLAPLGDLLRDFGKDISRTLGWVLGLALCASSRGVLGGEAAPRP